MKELALKAVPKYINIIHQENRFKAGTLQHDGGALKPSLRLRFFEHSST